MHARVLVVICLAYTGCAHEHETSQRDGEDPPQSQKALADFLLQFNPAHGQQMMKNTVKQSARSGVAAPRHHAGISMKVSAEEIAKAKAELEAAKEAEKKASEKAAKTAAKTDSAAKAGAAPEVKLPEFTLPELKLPSELPELKVPSVSDVDLGVVGPVAGVGAAAVLARSLLFKEKEMKLTREEKRRIRFELETRINKIWKPRTPPVEGVGYVFFQDTGIPSTYQPGIPGIRDPEFYLPYWRRKIQDPYERRLIYVFFFGIALLVGTIYWWNTAIIPAWDILTKYPADPALMDAGYPGGLPYDQELPEGYA